MDTATSEALVQQARALLSAEGIHAATEAGMHAKSAKDTGKRARPLKGQGRQLGDPELTEPDSDDDSLLGDDPPEYSTTQALEESTSPDSLSTEELLKRRLGHIKALFSSYKVEYWTLLEELRTRHDRFRNQQKGTYKPAEVVSMTPKPGAEDLVHVRDLAKGQQTDAHLTGSTPASDREPSANAAKLQQPVTTAAAPLSSMSLEGSAMAGPSTDSLQEASEPMGVDARGYGSEEDPVTFSDAEAVVLRTQEQPGAASKERIREWRADYRRQLPRLTRLEQASSASSCRELDRLGSVACLCGRHNRFIIRSSAVTLGRATDSNQVDIDLSTEGDARKVSRLQAQMSLRPNGKFQLKNIGRRRLLVNNRKVDQGQVAQLGHLSLVEVGGARLLLMVNHAATKRASARSLQLRNDL